MRSRLVVLLLIGASAYGLDPNRKVTQYVHRIWQTQQGLAESTVYSVIQTHDGYLWLGTQTGLVRFDGVRFTPIERIKDVSLAAVWVTRLLEDSQRSLWIGTEQAGLFRLKDGDLRHYSRHDGLPSDTIQCLFTDREGVLWACTPN